jgi:hypothetical protein
VNKIRENQYSYTPKDIQLVVLEPPGMIKKGMRPLVQKLETKGFSGPYNGLDAVLEPFLR